MGLRQEHAGHRLEPDESSGGFYLAYCLDCKRIVGDYDSDGELVYDDEHPEPEPKIQEYVINPDGSFGGVREVPNG